MHTSKVYDTWYVRSERSSCDSHAWRMPAIPIPGIHITGIVSYEYLLGNNFPILSGLSSVVQVWYDFCLAFEFLSERNRIITRYPATSGICV